MANVINEAALLAARYGKTDVTMDELDEAIDRILAGPQKKSRVMAQQEKKRVAYHESGYALVAQEAAHRVAGVHDVVNAIEVKTLSSEARSDIDPAQMARHVMEWDVLVPDEGITLTVDKGWITLEGTVKAWAQRNKAERTLQHLAGV